MKHEITKVVDILNHRGNSLFVACQLTDFFSYLSSGGICSKSRLGQSNLPQSKHETDIHLKNHDCWDAHIFHLVDYGALFYRKAISTPNPLGPILFHIKPDILSHATDIKMTHTSVRDQQFDAGSHFYPMTADALNACYQFSPDASFPEKSLLKNDLIDRNSITGNVPEIVCWFESDIIPFTQVSLVNVDHYVVNNRQFQSWVDEMKVRAGHTFPLMRRYCPSSTAIHISMELGKMLLKGPVTIADICQAGDEQLSKWGNDLKLKQTQVFDSFTKHLQSDTLLPLFEGKLSADTIDQLTQWDLQRNGALDSLSEKDAHAILTELAKTDPSIARRVSTMLK